MSMTPFVQLLLATMVSDVLVDSGPFDKKRDKKPTLTQIYAALAKDLPLFYPENFPLREGRTAKLVTKIKDSNLVPLFLEYREDVFLPIYEDVRDRVRSNNKPTLHDIHHELAEQLRQNESTQLWARKNIKVVNRLNYLSADQIYKLVYDFPIHKTDMAFMQKLNELLLAENQIDWNNPQSVAAAVNGNMTPEDMKLIEEYIRINQSLEKVLNVLLQSGTIVGDPYYLKQLVARNTRLEDVRYMDIVLPAMTKRWQKMNPQERNPVALPEEEEEESDSESESESDTDGSLGYDEDVDVTPNDTRQLRSRVKQPSPEKVPPAARQPSPAKVPPPAARQPSPAKTPPAARQPSPEKVPPAARQPSPTKTPLAAPPPAKKSPVSHVPLVLAARKPIVDLSLPEAEAPSAEPPQMSFGLLTAAAGITGLLGLLAVRRFRQRRHNSYS